MGQLAITQCKTHTVGDGFERPHRGLCYLILMMIILLAGEPEFPKRSYTTTLDRIVGGGGHLLRRRYATIRHVTCTTPDSALNARGMDVFLSVQNSPSVQDLSSFPELVPRHSG